VEKHVRIHLIRIDLIRIEKDITFSSKTQKFYNTKTTGHFSLATSRCRLYFSQSRARPSASTKRLHLQRHRGSSLAVLGRGYIAFTCYLWSLSSAARICIYHRFFAERFPSAVSRRSRSRGPRRRRGTAYP